MSTPVIHRNEPYPEHAPPITTPGDWMSVANDPSFGWSPIGLDYGTQSYPDEQWAKHPLFAVHVSDYGRIWGRTQNGSRGFKRQSFTLGGYLRLSLSYQGKGKQYYVARLVWESFHGPIPQGRNITNTTGMAWDNRIDSLQLTGGDIDVASLITPLRTCRRGHEIGVDNVVISSLYRKHSTIQCRACHNALNNLRRRTGPNASEIAEVDLIAEADRLYRTYTTTT